MEEGIVHFWELPDIWVKLEEGYRKEMMKKFLNVTETVYGASKKTGISRTTLRRYTKPNSSIRIDYLMKIISTINQEIFDENSVEEEVVWIGSTNSAGITNPKIPFDFNSRPAARFLAAICNDGWISDGACYSNQCNALRKSVEKDALEVFGGSKEMISEFLTTQDQYLRFPSVIRDVLNIVTDFRGIKSENNPRVPHFILENKELIYGWIEQTIADEGHIMHYPEKNRRELSWRRCFSKNLKTYNLIRDEKRMLQRIGIDYNFYDNEEYETSSARKRVKLQLNITRRKNLLKLRSLIQIPHPEKDNTFSEMLEGYTRYKERPTIKTAIENLCRKNGYVNSISLQKEMGYKRSTTALKWLKHFTQKGLLEEIKEGRSNYEDPPYNFILKDGETINVIN